MKILHTGDWHIGNYPGPERNGENVRFLDLCRCLDALVAKATEESPDIIVIAGDVFHQAKVWSDRGLRENRTATHYIRLLKKICPVVVVRGTPNHDSEQQFELLKNTFEGDGEVHIITEPGVVKTYTGRQGWVQIADSPALTGVFTEQSTPDSPRRRKTRYSPRNSQTSSWDSKHNATQTRRRYSFPTSLSPVAIWRADKRSFSHSLSLWFTLPPLRPPTSTSTVSDISTDRRKSRTQRTRFTAERYQR